MNTNNTKVITVEDFNAVCRICLQVGEKMIDIYESGIENQLMDITNLKMRFDDELPRTLCEKCSHQLSQFLAFVEQAKSSDIYLRTLLTDYKASYTDDGFKAAEETVIKEKPCKKNFKKLKRKSNILKKIENNSEIDKMYLIYVPESEGNSEQADSEICITDLNLASDNLGLTNYCKTLISNFSSVTSPKEQRNYFEGTDCGNIVYQPDSFLELNSDETKIYAVNLFIYECSECKETFEEMSDLTKHLLNHNMELSFLPTNFSCPICACSVVEKSSFMIHLQAHKEEGYFFVKVNAVGEIMPTNVDEKDLFIEPITKHIKYCKVFCINLMGLNCTICSSIQSKDSILDHLELCLAKEKSKINFNLRYICPICHTQFINDEQNFVQHLSSHKEENCYFIKVKDAGEPAQLEENDQLFVPYEEAVKFLGKKSSVFEIVDLNFCCKCSHRSDSFDELCEHYNVVHSEKFSPEISFCCPVCSEEHSGGNVKDDQAKFYEHLRKHKNEGMTFILVKKNGDMAELSDKDSDLFTQSIFLWSVLNTSALLFQNCSPELIILNLNILSKKFTCDKCRKQFRGKQELIRHLKSHQSKDLIQGKKKYICEKCGKKCSGNVSYNKHFLKHSKDLSSVCKKPVCVICSKTFANKSTLNRHMKHHLKEGKGEEFSTPVFGIICEKCGKNFSNNASLTKHKTKHSKEKESTLFKCDICGKDFFRQSSYERHKSAHLNPKYFDCHVCKIPISSLANLQKHLESHESGGSTFDCKDCKLSFLTKDSLSAHESHTGHYQDRKPLECNVCHEKFFITRKFMEHIKTHPKYKMGQCTLCGKRLSTIQSLMLHMGRHFESNSILCPHCGKQFFEEKNYHRHLLTHEGIKPFPCDIEGCKKSFYTLFELNRHKKYHNNTRDFSCPYCSKSFHEANHLTVHIRTHTGERPYTCPHCSKSFVTRTHCKHHIKLVHQGVGYDLIKSNISKKVTVFQSAETFA